MQLPNPFNDKVRARYTFCAYVCQDCGRSDRGATLHHIVGRSSASALNAILLCEDCHGRCGHSFEEQAKYFHITMKFLVLGHEWAPDQRDKEFYQEVIHRHICVKESIC